MNVTGFAIKFKRKLPKSGTYNVGKIYNSSFFKSIFSGLLFFKVKQISQVKHIGINSVKYTFSEAYAYYILNC